VEKEAIGRVCAGLIKPRQSLILDAGTTVYHVAKYLEHQVLQVVTNSLPVANLFISSQAIEVVVSGGVLYPRLGVMVGPLAVKAFSEIHADVAIMSAGGITLEGVTNSHPLLIDIQRAMIESASRVIFCLDHTKFDRRSVAFLCDLECLDTIVTDDGAPPELLGGLRRKGLEVLVAHVGPDRPADGDVESLTGSAVRHGPELPTGKLAEPGRSDSSESAPELRQGAGDESPSVVTWD
jgi:DeoR/GlpR family transcriptional regulator of sugar metabolism